MPVGTALLLCVVVGVTDGDSLTTRCQDGGNQKTIVIRLAEIDAPERRQPFGAKSKAALADLCFKQSVEIQTRSRDRWGRVVARVSCQGRDASAVQVSAGMAWAFTRYLTDPAIADLEAEARAGKVGLWADAAPVAPWMWRLDHRPQRSAAAASAAP